MLAAALHDCGHAEAATRYFELLRQSFPGRADIAYRYGRALHTTGHLEGAMEQWRQAVQLAPDHAGALHDLAMGLLDSRRDGEAAERLAALAGLDPQSFDAFFHLGNIRWRARDFAGAIGWYERALTVAPEATEGWLNLGCALEAAHRMADAEAAYRHAVALSPDLQRAHFSLATHLLRNGRWSEGFAEYCWRKGKERVPPSLASLPEWDGELRPGTRLALWNDQAFGDAIQFMRLARRLEERGGRAVLCLPAPLVRLARTLGIDAVHDVSGATPPDLHGRATLADLPHLLGETDPSEWERPPFLSAAAASLPRRGGRIAVGLVWACNPRNDHGRSIPLRDLAPLLDLPGIDWFSLQVGASAAQLADSPWADRVVDLASALHDFAATAACVQAMDLLISVDTAALHVAGALGKPVWVLVGSYADWRWGEGREDCAWYPTARVFRRAAEESWAHLARRVAERLALGERLL